MAENLYAMACAVERQALSVRMSATNLNTLMLAGAPCEVVGKEYTDLVYQCDVLNRQVKQLHQQMRLKIIGYVGTFDV